MLNEKGQDVNDVDFLRTQWTRNGYCSANSSFRRYHRRRRMSQTHRSLRRFGCCYRQCRTSSTVQLESSF